MGLESGVVGAAALAWVMSERGEGVETLAGWVSAGGFVFVEAILITAPVAGAVVARLGTTGSGLKATSEPSAVVINCKTTDSSSRAAQKSENNRRNSRGFAGW